MMRIIDIPEIKPLPKFGNWQKTVSGEWIYLLDYLSMEPRNISDDEKKMYEDLMKHMTNLIKDNNIKLIANGEEFKLFTGRVKNLPV